MHILARTNVGQVRKRNEDFFVVAPEHGLIVLCDGMGGHPGGDVASKMAAEEVQRSVVEGAEIASDHNLEVAELQPFAPLIRGVFSADRKLRAYGRRHIQYQGMGTTLAGLQERGGILCAVHVGDSRIYCLHGGTLRQLTQDHSIVATLPEAARASFAGIRNILTRALGVGEDLEVDFTVAPAQPDELYVLCTDGLHNYVTEERLVEVLTRESDRDKCLDTLIEDANQGGGGDNITLALAWVDAAPEREGPRITGAVGGGPGDLRVHVAS